MIGVGLYSVGFTSGFLVNSLFLQQLWHEPMRRTGQALLLSPLLSALSALLAGHLADRVGHRWLLVTGCLLRCFGYLLSVCLLGRESQLFDRFVPISGLIGLGSGIATWSAASLAVAALAAAVGFPAGSSCDRERKRRQPRDPRPAGKIGSKSRSS